MNSVIKITKRYRLWLALAGPLVVAAAAVVPLATISPTPTWPWSWW
jgi:hypothetical protein